ALRLDDDGRRRIWRTGRAADRGMVWQLEAGAWLACRARPDDSPAGRACPAVRKAPTARGSPTAGPLAAPAPGLAAYGLFRAYQRGILILGRVDFAYLSGTRLVSRGKWRTARPACRRTGSFGAADPGTRQPLTRPQAVAGALPCNADHRLCHADPAPRGRAAHGHLYAG